MNAQVCLRREPSTTVTISLHPHGFLTKVSVPLCVELMHTETAEYNRLLQCDEISDIAAGRLSYSASLEWDDGHIYEPSANFRSLSASSLVIVPFSTSLS